MKKNYKGRTLGEYEFGYEEFQVFKRKGIFHAAKRYAIRQIAYIVMNESAIEEERILYNLKNYYGLKKNKYDKADTMVSGIMVPLMLGLIATFPTLYMYVEERTNVIKLLILFATQVLFVEFFSLKYLSSRTDRKHYYDFYFDVICEYIVNKKLS